MALINALRSSFSSKRNWGNSAYIYALSILFLLSLAGNQLCQHKAIESTFSNTQLTIFLFNFPSYSHSPISLSSFKKTEATAHSPIQTLSRVSLNSPTTPPFYKAGGENVMHHRHLHGARKLGENLILLPIPPCPPSTGFSFSSQQFSVHIHKLFS